MIIKCQVSVSSLLLGLPHFPACAQSDGSTIGSSHRTSAEERDLSGLLNTVITDKIIMIKITKPKRPFSTLFLNDNDGISQCI